MLNILIADDEEPARKRLRSLLQPLVDAGRVQVVGEAADGRDVLEQLPGMDVDILLLDIQMPELDGFEVLTSLPAEERPAIIFTTAYDRYALQAFEENAVDYLLKPIARDRLEESISRVEERTEASGQGTASSRLDDLIEWMEQDKSGAETEFPQHISVSSNERIRVIPLQNVVSIEIEEGITRIYELANDAPPGQHSLRHHVLDYTLDYLEETLDPEVFTRVHRSAIVQVSYIQEMVPWFSGRYKLMMLGGREVIASRKRSKELKERLTV